ncbi:SmtA SAM-dependent methyltransferases [Candidatus Nanopelagicaceae bacterium]
MPRDPVYGSSTHYSGDAGVEYFAWQDASGEINGKINSRKFKSFIVGDEVILDFGCGGGHLINSLSASEKIGVEINPIARESAARFCKIVHGSIEEVKSESIDVVISNHALEHVPYPIRALSEILRVLKPGGKLILCVPIDDWRTQRQYLTTDINHHLNTWTPQLLGNSLSEAGFDLAGARISIYTHAWFPHYLKYWKFEFIFDLICRFYSIKMRRRQIIAVVNKNV